MKFALEIKTGVYWSSWCTYPTRKAAQIAYDNRVKAWPSAVETTRISEK